MATAPARKKKTPAAATPAAVPPRAPRPDGQATRQHLLETAGLVFAERGFAEATSKEICARAGTPMASVNYHFGSREALYEAVLIEAHRQVVDLQELAQLTDLPGATAKKRLRAVLSHLIGLATRSSTPWGFPVILREVLSPSPAVPALVEKALRPKAKLMLGLLGEVLGLPADHPAVQRALAFALLPCLVILVVPKQVSSRVLPAIGKDSEGLEEELLRYVMGGLEAMAKAAR